VTESSRVQAPGNILLCKKQEAAYNTPKMVGPLPRPYVCGSFSAPGCPIMWGECSFIGRSLLVNPQLIGKINHTINSGDKTKQSQLFSIST